MAARTLDDVLRTVVLEYGMDRVETALDRIRKARIEEVCVSELSVSDMEQKNRQTSRPKRKLKITARIYVAKLELPPETYLSLSSLADRFDNKIFLPTVGEVRGFCTTYGIEEPKKFSRTAMIPRIFGFLATLKPQDIRTILDMNSHSGPAQLAPISDAIRRSSKRRIYARELNRKVAVSSTDNTEDKSVVSDKPVNPSKI